MKGAKTLLVLACIGSAFYVGCARPPAAAAASACSVREAQRDVAQARRALARSEARLAEAKKVLAATRTYTTSYGASVGRWVRCARRQGFRWSDMATLMYVVNRESRGDPAATNSSSGAAGLLQFLPAWWTGKWDPYVPAVNLRHGARAVQEVGWQPWAL